MAELAVIVVLLATAGYMYLKGSVIRAYLLLMNTFVAAAIAFAYFETLGQLIVGYEIMIDWAFAASLVLIFVLVLAILNAIGGKLAPAEVYFGDFADKIIRSLLAVFAGLSIAGVILTAVAMMPIGTTLPYERFSSSVSNPPEPEKTLILSADGFITNVSSWLSRGSMSGQKSLAVFHPDLLNEIYLNRIGTDSYNKSVASQLGLAVESAWTPQAQLVSMDNQPISGGSQTKAVIIKARVSGAFSMSQVRLICKKSDSAGDLTGGAQIIWPIGYISGENTVERTTLSQKVTLTQLDFVFFIPSDTTPVMLELKQNDAAKVGRLTTGG